MISMQAKPGEASEAPMLHYRSTAEETTAPEEVRQTSYRLSEPESLPDKIVLWLTYGILAIVLLVWAVVGAIFWIPLLVRTMFRFTVSLVQTTMDAERPDSSARTLRDAVTFYRRGFVVAVDTVLGEEEAPQGTVRREYIDRGRMKREVIWAAVIWYVILWWLGPAPSPMEAWAWFVGLPWGETFESVAQTVAGGLDSLVGGGAEQVVDPQPAAPVPVPETLPNG